MADNENAATSGPKMVPTPRAVHQIHTGKSEKDVVLGGTILTDDLVAKHKLDLKALKASGAVEMVDILTA